MNNDGIKDIILGAGIDGYASPYGAVAIDGFNGDMLWQMESAKKKKALLKIHDFNGDNVDDIVIAGRDAEKE